MSLAAKIFKGSSSRVAGMSASISPSPIVTLVERMEVQAWSSLLVSKSLVSYVIKSLEEEVFGRLEFFVLSFSWTLEVDFNARPV